MNRTFIFPATQVLQAISSNFQKWAKPGLFYLLSFFSHDKFSTNLTINDGVLRNQTRVAGW